MSMITTPFLLLSLLLLFSPSLSTTTLPLPTILDLSARDNSRLTYLSSLIVTPQRKTQAPIASGRQLLQASNYFVKVTVGTPAQNLLLAVDTSNDAAWVPCDGCVGCPTTAPYFDSPKSTSFSSVGCGEAQCKQVANPMCSTTNQCGFNMTYGGSTFEAALSKDTLGIGGDSFPSYTFGCIKKATGSSIPPQGLLGLGRGPLSLLSQTQSTYLSTFSYCLPTFRSLNFTGSLRLGPKGQPQRIKFTPLLTNPRRPTLYYVSLTAVRVGNKIIPLPPTVPAFDPSTGGGTIIDSGTMFTRFVEPLYTMVRDEFRRRVKAPITTLGGFDTCYTGPIVAPTMTLMFSGMNVTLPLDNMLIHSTAGSTTCLAMAAAPSGVNGVLNVVANMQQQNHRVLFDVPNKRVGFARESCTPAL